MISRDVFLIHGPNFNILELRDKSVYGDLTLSAIESAVFSALCEYDLVMKASQSNFEGDIIEKIHIAIKEKAFGIIINAAAYSHTSVGILDALSCFCGQIVEVHLSNIFRRESFRHRSFVADVATGVVCGLGLDGYISAAHTLGRWYVKKTNS